MKQPGGCKPKWQPTQTNHRMFELLSCSFSCFDIVTAWKVSKYVVISGPYFPVFSPNTGKYAPEINTCLDTFHAVKLVYECVFFS